MTDRNAGSAAGAPIRILFLIIMIWLLGRFVPGSDMVLPEPFSTFLPAVYPIPSEIVEHHNSTSVAVPFHISRYDWLDGKGQFSDLDFIDPPVQSPKLTLHRHNPVRSASLALTQPTRVPIMDPQFAIGPDGPDNGNQWSFLSRTEPENLLGQDATAQSTGLSDNPATQNLSPLSVYFWLFARSGSNLNGPNALSTALQSGSAQYGGSQAGVIFSYRILGEQNRNLAVYSRASSALVVNNAGEIAIGAKVKPFRKLPLSLYAETRLRENASDSIATAIFIAGGSGPDRIATDTYLETYGQAGYVFQDDGSYFFDGSASVQRKILAKGNRQLSVGGAIWAGGQEGARRLDIGPRINIDIPLGDVAARVSVDWRQRVAGQAEPDSGISISLSTSF